MTSAQMTELSALYEEDETAWLEIMAEIVAQKRFAEIDYRNLSEYLSDMGIRDRREVKSHLVQLLLHVLKWVYQPDNRTASWSHSIFEQRLELRLLLESRTLRNHAADILDASYAMARKEAAKQTKLKIGKFPKDCLRTIDELLSDD